MIKILTSSGATAAWYEYDAWGNVTGIGGDADIANANPIRYRGYYYDTETGFYYLNSRYYDPETCRFVNADSLLDSNNIPTGFNLFSYCFNDPINYFDFSGHWAQAIKGAANAISAAASLAKIALEASKKSSHDANKRPYKGEPGSTYTAPDGSTRTYGPDSLPQHDYDSDDHGFPNKHPHDENGGHHHDWQNGKRGPAYIESWAPVLGITLVITCAVGITVVALDDVTGIGVADDFLFGPLGSGFGTGLIMIFG